MDAAVVRELGKPPEFGEFEDPVPVDGEVLVTVKAAALNPSTRATTSGAHDASRRRVPFVIGLDGVGVLADGRRVFFGGPRTPFGTFAQKTVAQQAKVEPRHCSPRSPPARLLLDTFATAMEYAANGTLTIDTAPMKLADIGTAWADGDRDGRRVVVLP